LISALSTLIYCYFEEIGWRGYLHDELGNLKEWKRILITGFLWYLWHLSFIHETGILNNLIFLGILTLGSWGLAKVVEHSKSVLAAAGFHMLINVVMMNSVIRDGLSSSEKLIFLGISLPLFVFILIIWQKNNKRPLEKKE
jgi:membrane protease YdiL (CAAX protease family)